jgi:hypothetical protein
VFDIKDMRLDDGTEKAIHSEWAVVMGTRAKNPCHLHTTCQDCSDMLGCGWCVHATSSGLSGTCAGPEESCDSFSLNNCDVSSNVRDAEIAKVTTTQRPLQPCPHTPLVCASSADASLSAICRLVHPAAREPLARVVRQLQPPLRRPRALHTRRVPSAHGVPSVRRGSRVRLVPHRRRRQRTLLCWPRRWLYAVHPAARMRERCAPV